MKYIGFSIVFCLFAVFFFSCSTEKVPEPDPSGKAVKPSIQTLTPRTALAGEQLTITGSDFGSNQSAVSVTFDGKQAEIISFSDQEIKVIVPDAAGNTASARIQVKVGDLSSDPFAFTYEYPEPEIGSVFPAGAAAGTAIQLKGSGFGNSRSQVLVIFGGKLATVRSVTDSVVEVTVPDYAGKRVVDVQVAIREKSSNTVTFSYEPGLLAPTLNLADPFVLLHDGIYYAYGTGNDRGIPVYVSTDLETWEPTPALALDMSNSYGERWFWAPEVYYANGTFYMYYSANERICVATSSSPLGPFAQHVKQPMFAERAIDNGLFIDQDGTPYMYFDRFNDGLNIWVAELEPDLMTIKSGTLTKCINVSQPWEQVWPRVNEGPYVIKHKDLYYLTYSANSYESPFYGIGFATATSPKGPWTKYEGNPILQKPGDLEGVGHSAMFTDKEGKLRIVFHSHNRAGVVQPRKMHISSVYFEELNGQTIMKIDQNYTTPKVLQ